MSNESSSCGCSAPIVCTLADRETQARHLAEFRDVFAYLERTEARDGGFRWYFRADETLESRLRDLAQREQECCRFFDFHLKREGTLIIWETHAPTSAAAVLEEFMRLPATLKSAPTLDAMKRAFGIAGLSFVSEADDKIP